jgi:peroxiredoxin
MKALATILLATTFLFAPTEDQLKIGEKAPKQDLQLKNIDGNDVTLEKLKGEKGLLVIYSCNTCPWVVAWEDRYNEIYKQCANEGIGFVLVNSNEAKREGADSMEEMAKHAKEKGYFNFPYVVDQDHILADSFGATKTPDVFLFNADMELVYKGAIDDNSKDKNGVEEPYLMNAVKALSAGAEINPAETKALGCSIKRIKS